MARHVGVAAVQKAGIEAMSSLVGNRWKALQLFLEVDGVQRIEAARMTEFTSRHNYDEITRQRLAHLDSLGLPLQGRSVLELGAGVGELTDFWLAKGCAVLTSDGRIGNVLAMRKRFGASTASQVIDMRSAETMPRAFFSAEIVFCYGLLYHLPDPAATIAWMEQAASPAAQVREESFLFNSLSYKLSYKPST